MTKKKKRTPFIADERTLRWCARRVRFHVRYVDGEHWGALHSAADDLLESAPRRIKRAREGRK